MEFRVEIRGTLKGKGRNPGKHEAATRECDTSHGVADAERNQESAHHAKEKQRNKETKKQRVNQRRQTKNKKLYKLTI